jgi:uncharacterized protein YdeI (YjbR/CyaY-like superfamily)
MAAFLSQSRVIVTKSVWHTKSEILTIWSFKKKFPDSFTKEALFADENTYLQRKIENYYNKRVHSWYI